MARALPARSHHLRPVLPATPAVCHTCRIVWPHTLIPLGDHAVTVSFPELDTDTSRSVVRALDGHLREQPVAGITDVVRALHSLTVHFEPLVLRAAALNALLAAALDVLEPVPAPSREPIVIPVCYDEDLGPDLPFVAQLHGTTPDEIIRAHTAAHYTVSMIGFLPGFPYLDGLPAALHTPRRATPRTRVPAGSVGIGGASTGVYPCESPGGWHLIGRTTLPLFDPTRAAQPALLAPDDRVQFVAISRHVYDRSLRRA